MADKNMEAQISVEFEEATSRQSLNSGETINTLWSKVKRWLSDLKAVAFSGSYNDLSDKPTSLPANGGDAETVNGHTVESNVPALGYYYATCDSPLTTNIKTVTCEGFEFKEGARITIRFTAGSGENPPSAPVFLLKINEDDGRNIFYNDWYGEGTLGIIDSKKSEAFCGNQVWDFIFINGRFIMQAPLRGYQMDDALSDHSGNPVYNSVIKAELDKKADKTTATTDTNGLMSAEDKSKLDNADNTYALKSLYGNNTINVGRKADTTVGGYSTAEGKDTTAIGYGSHAEGKLTIASGHSAHAEGSGTTANGSYSHAEGISVYTVTNAIPDFSNTTSDEDIINVWNKKPFNLANDVASHSEGRDNLALGIASHAEGYKTIASGENSHTGGHGTKALHLNEVAYGKYNVSNDDTLFSIGDGTTDNERHNAFEITTTGGKLHDQNIATTDLIPTELPANGGNADTVGLRHSNEFLGRDYVYPTFAIYGFGADLNNYVTEYHGFVYNCENSPIANDYGFLDVSFFDGIGFLPSPSDKGGVVLQKFSRIDNCVFTRMRVANVWSDWKEISTTPIKKNVLFERGNK